MADLASFFKESHTSMGAFYPLHYLVAVYEDLDTAKQAARTLRNGGMAEDDVIAVSGEEYLKLNRDEEGAGVITTVAKSLSRGIGTEQLSNDHNEFFAHQGKAFVFAYCPSDEEKTKAWNAARVPGVLAAHHYSRFSVDHLACDFDTT